MYKPGISLLRAGPKAQIFSFLSSLTKHNNRQSMKAFISHSSKDKHIAKAVADELGELRCEYDNYTFDFVLNSDAIRRALLRSDIFVLLLSQNSINSNFVSEEIRGALESRGAGKLKNVYIFALDKTSYELLPDWLREVNVAQLIRNGKQIAHRINAFLTEFELNCGNQPNFYFGRDEQEGELRRALAKPRLQTPLALHIVGNHGVGRRTFLRNVLRSVAPRQYTGFIEITIDKYDSIEELYRKLYDYLEVPNPLIAGERIFEFQKMSISDKVVAVTQYFIEFSNIGIIPILMDEGGVLDDDGDYQSHLAAIITQLETKSRPLLLFVQTRMMRHRYKQKYPRSFHIRIPCLSDETTFELLSLTLKDLDVDFDEGDARKASEFADGHPFNVNFIAAYIADVGMDVLLADPGEVIEFKLEKGTEFLQRINFSEIECDILTILHEYSFCDLAFITNALGNIAIVDSIRNLEDHCCVERREKQITISPPLRDAIRRDKRVSRSNEWAAEVARRVVASLQSYQADESLPLSFIDNAIPDLLRSKTNVPFVSILILPSHLLRVGRDYFNKESWQRCVEFCSKALQSETILTMDAKIEANRLLGLSFVRIDHEDPKIDAIIKKLRSYATRTAQRVAFFIEGFRARRRGEYEVAEERYNEAYRIEPKNFHINRELSSVLCKMGRYAEAEPFARAALNNSPDNPYILDVLVEALEGKSRQGLPINYAELKGLDVALERVCESGGFNFYAIRESRRLFATKRRVDAFALIANAIARDSKAVEGNVEGLIQRAEMFIEAGDLSSARKDIENLRKFGSHHLECIRHADRLEIDCLIAEGRLQDAKAQAQKTLSYSDRVLSTTYLKIAKAIAYEPSGCPRSLIEWSKSIS
jgi:tetratricopeptide (TPR) repeat protein